MLSQNHSDDVGTLVVVYNDQLKMYYVLRDCCWCKTLVVAVVVVVVAVVAVDVMCDSN